MKSIKTLFVLVIALTVATTASAYNFNKDLELGTRGDDVTKLQEMLVNSGYLGSDSVTGYFGPSTELAVAKWQIAYGVKPVSGIFGAISRSVISRAGVENLATVSTNFNSNADLSGLLSQEQNSWFSSQLIAAGYIPEKLGEKILEPLRKMSKAEILSWASVLEQNNRISSSEYQQVQNILMNKTASNADIFRLVTPNNGEVLTLAPRTRGSISGLEKSVYTIDWEGGSKTGNGKHLVGDSVKAFLEKKVESKYVTVGRIPNLGDDSIQSMAGYYTYENCRTTDIAAVAWTTSCNNYSKYKIADPGQYYIRLLDVATGISDRSDKPITFSYGSLGNPYDKYPFDRYIKYESTGPDVVALEELMTTLGFLEKRDSNKGGYFGPLLREAIGEWQEANNITNTGYWGSVVFSFIRAKQGKDVKELNVTNEVEDTQNDGVTNGSKVSSTNVKSTQPTPKKLSSSKICAVVQKPTNSTCIKKYPIRKGTEKIIDYVYNGFKYDITYKMYVNSENQICRDTCRAKAK